MNSFLLRRALSASVQRPSLQTVCKRTAATSPSVGLLGWKKIDLVSREADALSRANLWSCPRRFFSSHGTKAEVTVTKHRHDDDDDDDSDKDKKSTAAPCHGAWEKPEEGARQDKERHATELQHLIRLHYRNAQFYEALQSSLELLDCCEDMYGSESKNHPAIASAHNNAGLMYKMLGKYDDARRHYHAALRMYKEKLGADHSSYATALNNLGNLDKAQATSPPSGEGNSEKELSSLDRVAYMERAIEYFDEAYRIRLVELGESHPHTVTSRTNLGSALASFVMEQQASLLRGYYQRQQRKGEAKEEDAGLPKMSKFTRQRWEAAEEHLREALQTAIDNPRGRQIPDEMRHAQQTNPATTLQTIPKKYRSKKSNNELRKAQPKQKPKAEENRAETPTPIEQAETSPLPLETAVTTPIRTISAAAAAQNLAVFLKRRADCQRAMPSTADASTAIVEVDPEEGYIEARSLYQQALRVREQLLQAHHPDTIVTKFSLAELYEAVGNEQYANHLRQEILDGRVEERVEE